VPEGVENGYFKVSIIYFTNKYTMRFEDNSLRIPTRISRRL
jgi:hypothetical protein